MDELQQKEGRKGRFGELTTPTEQYAFDDEEIDLGEYTFHNGNYKIKSKMMDYIAEIYNEYSPVKYGPPYDFK